jgi:hypothetical protein
MDICHEHDELPLKGASKSFFYEGNEKKDKVKKTTKRTR